MGAILKIMAVVFFFLVSIVFADAYMYGYGMMGYGSPMMGYNGYNYQPNYYNYNPDLNNFGYSGSFVRTNYYSRFNSYQGYGNYNKNWGYRSRPYKIYSRYYDY